MTHIMVRAPMTEDLSIIDSEAKSRTNKSVSWTSDKTIENQPEQLHFPAVEETNDVVDAK